jgi:hypothetical protein
MSLFNRLFPMPPAELQLFLRRCGRPMIHLRNLVGSEAGPFSHVLRDSPTRGEFAHQPDGFRGRLGLSPGHFGPLQILQRL